MFRRRIYAQGFTIAAMCVGSIYWAEDREKRKKWDKMLAEKIRLEKRQAWIKELEARDREDEELQRKKEAARAKAAMAASVTQASSLSKQEVIKPPEIVKAVKELAEDG